MTGLPSLSLPFGTDAQGLPIGIQLINNTYQHYQLLQIGHRLYQAYHSGTR